MVELNITLLKGEIQHIKDIFVRAALDGQILDVSFIGNTSGLYAWEPAPIVDMDVCLFVHRRDRKIGLWLARTRQLLIESMNIKGIDFDLRIIRGPYKQTLVHIERPIIVVHMSLFTEELYLNRPRLLRWAWRKYSGVVEPSRLARMAPERPTFHELLYGRSGVTKKLESVKSGSAPFLEYTIPDLAERAWTVSAGDPLFAEYCLAAGAICARNHARVLDKPEPDFLGNREFAAWYDRNVLNSLAFRALMELKDKVRKEGYGKALLTAPYLAQVYLSELSECLTEQAESYFCQ
jgi:hypothetical protein